MHFLIFKEFSFFFFRLFLYLNFCESFELVLL